MNRFDMTTKSRLGSVLPLTMRAAKRLNAEVCVYVTCKVVKNGQ
jgi:hypothetical protein